MCGLCGYYTNGNVTETHVKILKGLLIANQDRGSDSTGVAWCGVKDRLYKRVKPAVDFVDRLSIKKSDKIAIGHTRLATHGVINRNNAHPFTKGNITGAHNGVVSNYLTINDKVEVDSEVIFELIDREGFEKAFEQLAGMFAVVWHDKNKPDEINLVRSGNPLTLAHVPGVGYFWSSEALHLQAVLSQNYENYDIVEIKSDIVYTITPKEIVQTAVRFKPYTYTAGVGKYGGSYQLSAWERDMAGYDELDDEYNEPRSIYGGEHSPKDILWDICNTDGCCICGRILSHVAWTDKDGFVYCWQCQNDYVKNGEVEKHELY